MQALPGVRTTLVVVSDETTTSLWEAGVAPGDPGAAEAAVVEAVTSLLDSARGLVVSGSTAPGLSNELAARLGALGVSAGVPVVVDTSGPGLLAAAGVPGVIVMPNSDEVGDLPDEPAATVLVTRGSDGMLVPDGADTWRVPVPEVVSGNPTGAGDAAAAGIIHGLVAGHDLLSAACDAVALAASAVAAPVAGEVDPALRARLRPLVSPTRLEGTR